MSQISTAHVRFFLSICFFFRLCPGYPGLLHFCPKSDFEEGGTRPILPNRPFSSCFASFFHPYILRVEFYFSISCSILCKNRFLYPKKFTKIPLDSDVNHKFIAQKLGHFLSTNSLKLCPFFLQKSRKKSQTHSSNRCERELATLRTQQETGDFCARTNERTDGPILGI